MNITADNLDQDHSGTFISSYENMENVSENAFKYIYQECDESGSGNVAVSKLIEFVQPFMKGNLFEIEKLREALDPDQFNPEISCDHFLFIMSIWERRIDDSSCENNNSGDSFDENANEGEAVEITAEKSELLKKLEDEIKEHAHQYRKCSEELAMTRAQLLNQEEQNVVLQSNIEKISKQLSNERAINDNLLQETNSFDEIREDSCEKQRHIDKLLKQIHYYEKEVDRFNDIVKNYENEKLKLEERIFRLHDKLKQHRKVVHDLETEIHTKNTTITNLHEDKDVLLSNIDELNKVVECLNEEKDTLDSYVAVTLLNNADQENDEDEISRKIQIPAAAANEAISLLDEMAAMQENFCETCKDRQELLNKLDDLRDEAAYLRSENANLLHDKQIFQNQVDNNSASEAEVKEAIQDMDGNLNELHNKFVQEFLANDENEYEKQEAKASSSSFSIFDKNYRNIRRISTILFMLVALFLCIFTIIENFAMHLSTAYRNQILHRALPAIFCDVNSLYWDGPPPV